MLYQTGVTIDFLVNKESYILAESWIKGGVAFSNLKHAVAKLPSPWNPQQKTIFYFDVVSLYTYVNNFI